MLSLDDAGKTVGRLYALSTVGSILGTFAAGFVLIPFVGSVRTMYGISAVLVVLSLILVPFKVTRIGIAVILLFGLSIITNETNSYMLREANDLHDIDSEYSRIQVFRTTDPRTRRPIRALATDPYFTQSAMFLDSDSPALDYSKYYHLAQHYRPGFRSTLVIGGAGYSVPKDFLRRYPDTTIDVVEIDPQMTLIARRFFRLVDDPRLNIVHEDARTYLNRSPSGKYDIILMDAFGSLFSVPYQLTTIEAVREMRRNISDNGVVIFNLGSAITGEGSRFLHSELATYREVFPHVLVFKVNAEYTDDRLQNLMIVALAASGSPLENSADAEINSLLVDRYDAGFPTTAGIITDDLAPVEYYNSIAQNLYLESKR